MLSEKRLQEIESRQASLREARIAKNSALSDAELREAYLKALHAFNFYADEDVADLVAEVRRIRTPPASMTDKRPLDLSLVDEIEKRLAGLAASYGDYLDRSPGGIFQYADIKELVRIIRAQLSMPGVDLSPLTPSEREHLLLLAISEVHNKLKPFIVWADDVMAWDKHLDNPQEYDNHTVALGDGGRSRKGIITRGDLRRLREAYNLMETSDDGS